MKKVPFGMELRKGMIVTNHPQKGLPEKGRVDRWNDAWIFVVIEGREEAKPCFWSRVADSSGRRYA